LRAGSGRKNLSTPYFDNLLIKGLNDPMPKPTAAIPGQSPIYLPTGLMFRHAQH
jgi:galactosylceramidase